MTKRFSGRIKWFDNNRGYGFIVPDGTEDEYFVHFTSIVMEGYKTLKVDQRVTFEIKQTDKGVQAINVTPV